MYTFSGSNPAQIYLDALYKIQEEGENVSPRGMEVKEIRPASIEYTNPLNRVVFLEGRKMNPFFLGMESLWIACGRSDVEFLTNYNKGMAAFSDDGEFFNAPYGQRLRAWNTNSVSGFIFNPIDQLIDVYEKLKKDKDSRQAVASIYNPLFDNVDVETLDRPCNLQLVFKIRNDKLTLTVYNRSNDIHYGVFTNLVQFSVLQELMAVWLGVGVGEYHQVTDSLHNYLNDFGAKETEKIFNAYPEHTTVQEFTFENEPRMSTSFEEFEAMRSVLFGGWFFKDLHRDEAFKQPRVRESLLMVIKSLPDNYWRNMLYAAYAYRAHKLEIPEEVIVGLDNMAESSWKMSCIHFLYEKYKDNSLFRELYAGWSEDKVRFIEGKKQRKY
ncbi:thymidylate synthase [Bacillus subtilis]|uniref:thymidylate synthase n=1 Tax=Bacillus subtilis TaxID=1423 RepID=UPI0025C92E55|nr:thymidylate synthase [Bacillus subtilis]WCS68059.1 thymidylate synthase [Bacillus phage vB_BsuM-Goe26]GLI90896.1 hypothetical protein ANABIO4_42480 [Bacillus subtilis]